MKQTYVVIVTCGQDMEEKEVTLTNKGVDFTCSNVTCVCKKNKKACLMHLRIRDEIEGK